MSKSKRQPYTTQSLTRSVSSESNCYGEKQYTKKGLQPYEVDNFCRAENLGIGMKILDFKRDENGEERSGWVKMKCGTNVQEIIDRQYEPLYKFIPDQLRKIHQILKNNNLAHCDIKPLNLAVRGQKLYLIDNEGLTQFGKRRKIGTIGVNIKYHPDQVKQVVSSSTDDMGVKYTLDELDKVIKHKPINSNYGIVSEGNPRKAPENEDCEIY